MDPDTEKLVPQVTNRERFPDADAFLPKFILINQTKILVLKKNRNVVKFKVLNSTTFLMLCEPHTASDQFDQFENDNYMISNAILRMKEILPFSENYPEIANDN